MVDVVLGFSFMTDLVTAVQTWMAIPATWRVFHVIHEFAYFSAEFTYTVAVGSVRRLDFPVVPTNLKAGFPFHA